jgi:tetratricopeptide (TPR) repeat protein/TolB-like protein
VNDQIYVEYPEGGYAPLFTMRSGIATEPEAGPEIERPDSIDADRSADAKKREYESAVSTQSRNLGPTILAGALVLGFAVAILWLSGHFTPWPSRTGRKSIAVLSFQNLSSSSEDAWLSAALAEMLRTELSVDGKVRMISGEGTARASRELDVPASETLSKETLAKVGNNLGADMIVTGAFVAMQNPVAQLRLDVHVQSVASGETTATASASGPLAAVFGLVSRSGAELREKLGLGPVDAPGRHALQASLPGGQVEMRLYSEGVEKLRLFEALAARDLLAKSIELDPNYAVGHSALAEAWSQLGYSDAAKREALKAFELSGSLPREDRWLIEGRLREMNHEWERAIQIYKSLREFYPDVIDHALRLAETEVVAGRGKEALSVVQEVRQEEDRTAHPFRHDARIDLAEARAYNSLSDYGDSLVAAQRARESATSESAWLTVAAARIEEGQAFWRIGKLGPALASFDKARTLYAGVSDKRGVAEALNAIANIASDQGDLITTEKTYEDALRVFREIGDKKGTASALNDLAVLLKNQGNRHAARPLYEESLAVSKEIGDSYGQGRALFNLAFLHWDDRAPGPLPLYREALKVFESVGSKNGERVVLHELGVWSNNHGQLTTALTYFDRSVDLAAASGAKADVAFELGNRTGVLTDLGRLGEARASAAKGLVLCSELSLDVSFCSRIHDDLGRVLLQTGDIVGARAEYAAAGRLFAKSGNQAAAALNLARTAECDLEDGLIERAESIASQAVDELQRRKSADREANIILADCLLRAGKHWDARKVISRTQELAKIEPAEDVNMRLGMLQARERAAAGDRLSAMRILRDVVSQAQRDGYRGIELKARLLVAQVIRGGANIGTANAQLLSVISDAKALGFNLIARQATQRQF